MERVLTVCPYCGVGCGLYLLVKEGRITGAEGDPAHPVSEGELCLKGSFGHRHVHDPRRLQTPLIRKEGRLTPVGWAEALEYVGAKLDLLRRHTPDAFALIASARATNEDNYVAQKFARTVIGTNNVDHCARL